MGRPAHFAQSPAKVDESSASSKSPVLVAPIVVALAVFVVQGLFLALSRPAIRVIALTVIGWVATAALLLCALRMREDARNGRAFQFRVFACVLLGLGLLYLFVFPPITVPDEDVHFSASYSYANLLDPMMGPNDVRVEDREFMQDETLYSKEVKADFWLWQKSSPSVFAIHEGVVRDDEFAHAIDFGTDAPQLKLFSSLGILLGRAFNLSGVSVFYLGRLFNFLSCFALILLAVHLIPIGRTIMMTLSLLPMTLHMLGSYSYDAMIISLSFLLIALLLRAIMGAGTMSRGLAIASVVVAVLLAPCKIVYYALVLLALAVPASRFESRRVLWLWRCCMLVLPLASIVVMRLGKLVIMAGVGAEQNASARRSNTTPLYSLRDVLLRPCLLVEMTVRALYRHGDFYLSSMVGGSLGWFQENIAAYRAQETALILALLCSSLSAPDDKETPSLSLRIASLVTFAIGFLLVFFSLTLIWTTVGADTVQGVQGRYFLPFMPLLLLGIRTETVVARKCLCPMLVACLTGFSCLYLAQIAFVVLGGVI